jgi:hypothetical protein
MDLVSCKAAYRTLAEKVFQKSFWRYPFQDYVDAYRGKPWYSGAPLEQAVREMVSRRLSQKEKDMLSKGTQRTAAAEAPLASLEDYDCKT